MMERKFTDDEIVKALECCSKKTLVDDFCDVCPNLAMGSKCMDNMLCDALDLINRQKAENERLTETSEEAVSCFHRMESLYNIKCMELKVAKAEATISFAKRLCDGRVSNDPVVIAAEALLKELTEDKP